jgi:hypothetical protein
LSPAKIHIPGADAVAKAEGYTNGRASASAWRTRRGRRTWHVWKLVAREPGDPTSGQTQGSDLVCIGILEDGIVTINETGTGQGSVVSPLLANVYLHYVFDLWAERWRRREASGDMIIVRYAMTSSSAFSTRLMPDGFGMPCASGNLQLPRLYVHLRTITTRALRPEAKIPR